jgi:hypothetical protein
MDRRRDVGGSARNFALVGRARTHGGHAPEVGREPAHGPSAHRDEIELLWDEQTASLPKDGMFLKKRFFTDEQIARFPALGETQREWDTLPRRERLRQRLAWMREYGLTVWSRFALGGFYLFMAFLFIGGPIIKFLVPGGSDWLHRNVGTVMLLCLAPLALGIALYFVGGWVALPFWLGRGLWRRRHRLRGYDIEEIRESFFWFRHKRTFLRWNEDGTLTIRVGKQQARIPAASADHTIRQTISRLQGASRLQDGRGDIVHRLGVDDFEEVHEALREGKYVIFDTAALEDDEEDVE